MLIILLIFLLMSNAVTTRQEKSILFARIVIKSILFISYLALNNIYIHPLEKGIGIYGGLFHVNVFTHTFNIFILLISAVILTLNAFYTRKIYSENYTSLNKMYNFKLLYNKREISNTNGEQYNIIEYPLIIVFILCGAVFLISTNDLISLFLSIELQSYGLYIISTLYRDSEFATASGLTYFLLGGLSSCFILLGSALLYVNSGTTNIENIYIITSLSEISKSVSYLAENWYQPYYLYLSLIIMTVGFLFKVSAAPFHFWSPDVYDGIPTVVTTYVAIIAKISIFAFLLEFVHYTEYNILGFSWNNVLILSSFLSLIIGSVLGLTQFRIKRLFAYSTINHVGFILLALSINTTESIQAYIFYILQYTLSNLNAFIILVTIGFSFYNYTLSLPLDGSYEIESKNNLKDKKNSPIQLISQVRGYFYLNPFIAISLAITLFSFTGIPPLIGFFGKQMILSAALDNGYIFMALIAILTSVISAAYYLNLIKEVFFFHPSLPFMKGKGTLGLTNSLSSPLSYINKETLNKKEYGVTEKENLTNTDDTNVHTTSLEKGKIKAFLVPYSYYNKLNSQDITFENISMEKKEEDYKIKEINVNNIIINSSLTSTISILTLLLILFIYIPEEWFNIVSILSLIIFKS